MPNYPEEIRSPPPGRWMWSEESHSLEFVRCCPAEESVRRRRSQNHADFNELQRRAAWLAETCSMNCRGRQSTRKHVTRAQLSSYRATLMRNQGDDVTLDDVKQVAVSLLQDNYLLPIPFYFLDVLKSKELDEVLAALLVYLSCFFEQKSLENKDASLVVVDIVTEERRMTEAVGKKELAQNKLAVCYFSLMMDLEREQHLPNHEGQMTSDKTEWLLHACLYSFLCYFAWVTFDRKELGDIQAEVGRLLYSDTFNTAVSNEDDAGHSGSTSGTGNASAKKTGTAGPQESRWTSACKHRRPAPRRPAPGGVVNHRSPLMMSLLPSPEERSPHLFPGTGAGSQSPLGAARRDITAPREQLAAVRCGIVGRPLTEFSRSTLTPVGGLERRHGDSGRDDDRDDDDNKSADRGALKGAARPSQDPTG